MDKKLYKDFQLFFWLKRKQNIVQSCFPNNKSTKLDLQETHLQLDVTKVSVFIRLVKQIIVLNYYYQTMEKTHTKLPLKVNKSDIKSGKYLILMMFIFRTVNNIIDIKVEHTETNMTSRILIKRTEIKCMHLGDKTSLDMKLDRCDVIDNDDEQT